VKALSRVVASDLQFLSMWVKWRDMSVLLIVGFTRCIFWD